MIKKSQLRLLLKKIVTEAKILENIQDPTKDEMFNYLHQMYGNEEGFRDNAEVAIYWFANFFHGGQSSNLYSVLSTSRFSPGPVARGPEKQSMEEMMYEDLVLKYAPNSEDAVDIQRKHNALNESMDGNTNPHKRTKDEIYRELTKHNFEQKGQEPRTYVEYYVWNYATIFCMVDLSQNRLLIQRYFDSERLDSHQGYHIEKIIPLPEQYSPDFVKKTVEACEKMARGIKGSESIEGGMDDLEENGGQQTKTFDHAVKLIKALRSGIINRIKDPEQFKMMVADFNERFKESCPPNTTAWEYFKDADVKNPFVDEGDEADAANDMWTGSDDEMKSYEEPKKRHPKQKSTSFLRSKKSKAKTVQDFDWKRIRQNIDKGTLKESSLDDLFEGNYRPQGKWGVTCKKCHTNATIDIGKYGNFLRGLGAEGWKEIPGDGYYCPKCQSDTLNEGALQSLAAALMLGTAGFNTPVVKNLMHNPQGQQAVMRVKQAWASMPQAQRTINTAKELWNKAMSPIKVPNPTQALPDEQGMDASALAQKYSDRNDDVAQKAGGFVNKYLSGQIKKNDIQKPNPLDGKSNVSAAQNVNKVLSELSKGMFSDDSWQAINKIFTKLNELGLDVNILSTKYGGQEETSNGMAKYKEWQISIPFTNKVGKPMELVGQITAHGAGSIEQPLDRYDITAYVSAIPARK